MKKRYWGITQRLRARCYRAYVLDVRERSVRLVMRCAHSHRSGRTAQACAEILAEVARMRDRSRQKAMRY